VRLQNQQGSRLHVGLHVDGVKREYTVNVVM
jgi:hypothetical protein